jgi:hypothetical protein
VLRLTLITAAVMLLFALSPLSNVVKSDSRAAIPVFNR